MHRNRVYDPNYYEIRKLILWEMDNVPYAKHQGYQKTHTTVRK